MPHPKWTRLSKEPFFKCPFYTFAHDTYCLPDGSTGDYYYLDIPGSSMIIPRLDRDRLIMVRQYRYLMGRHSLEFPAGGIREGSDPLENARKELREEAGYQAGEWQKIGEFAPYNGASNEICNVFLASGLIPVKAEPEPTEEFEIVHVPMADIPGMISSGDLWDGQTILAFTYFQLWLKQGVSASGV